jgi:hypothetical protein
MSDGDKPQKSFLDNFKIAVETLKIIIGLILVWVTWGIRTELPYIEIVDKLMDDFSGSDKLQNIALITLDETIGNDPKRVQLVVAIAKAIGEDKARQVVKNGCKEIDVKYFQIKEIKGIVKNREPNNFSDFEAEINEILRPCLLAPGEIGQAKDKAEKSQDSVEKQKLETKININQQINEQIIKDQKDKQGVVYIHYQSSSFRSDIDKLEQHLSEKGWIVRPSQLIPNKYGNQIRYFHTDDLQLAKTMQQEITNRLNIDCELKDFSKQYSSVVPPKQLEIWLSSTSSRP